jgi:hypothetical protein
MLGRHLVQRRLERAFLGAGGDRRQALRLGLQRRQPVRRLARRAPSLRLRRLGGGAVGFGRLQRRAGLAERGFGARQRLLGGAAARIFGRAERRAVQPGLVQRPGGPRQARAGFLEAGLRGAAVGLGGGELGGEALDLGVGGPAHRVRGLGLRRQFGQAFRRGLDLDFQLAGFSLQAGQRATGILDDLTFAAGVGDQPGDLGLQARDFCRRALELPVEPVLLDLQPVQYGGGGSLLVAQRPDRRGGRGGGGAGGGGGPGGALGFGADADRLLVDPAQRGARLGPSGVQDRALQRPDLRRQLLVAFGLARLALQSAERGVEFLGQVVQSRQVGLGGVDLQLGFVAAGVQAGDAGRFLQDQAPVLRLGGDQLGDLTLPHQRRRVGPGRGVGEQQLHVARPHFLAVDPVARAGAAIDPAHHLQHRMSAERDRRAAVGVVDGQRHLGVVAAGPPARASEDHVVHAGPAHRLGRVRAHHPAQAFQQVRLAAAVGADDAGQPRFDPKVGRIDEGLEA